jgi:protein-L-isoaspartate(D-aspartate) O-methyltransferase
MVQFLRDRGLPDERVLAAMGTVPRHRFVKRSLANEAYADHPLPIGSDQTISQPYVVAVMAMAAEISPEDRVAEIGTGSGYGAAVLAQLAAEVWTVERLPKLAKMAARRLVAEGYDNVHVLVGDGTAGIGRAAPFDAVVVTAAPERVPGELFEQLVDGGRLIIPVGPTGEVQHLHRIRRVDGRAVTEDLGGVRFVPLVSGPPGTPIGRDAGRRGGPAT